MPETVTLTELKITREQLMRLSRQKRNLFLQCCHISNELNSFAKCLRSAYTTGTPVESEAQLAIFLAITRVIMAKTWEGWQFVRNALLTRRGEPKPDLRLNSELVQHLRVLQSIFADKGLFKQFRDKFTFHFDPEQMAIELDSLDPDFESTLYVNKTFAHCLYLPSEVLMLHHMKRVLDTTSLQTAVDTLGPILRSALEPLISVLGLTLLQIAKDELSPLSHALNARPVTVALRQVQPFGIPFFAEQSKPNP